MTCAQCLATVDVEPTVETRVVECPDGCCDYSIELCDPCATRWYSSNIEDGAENHDV